MNPITLHIDGQDYVFRYIPAPNGFRYRLLEYLGKARKAIAIDAVYPFYMAETVMRGRDRKPKTMNDEGSVGGMSWYDGIALCARLTSFQNNTVKKSNNPSDQIFESYQAYKQAVKSNQLFIRLPTEFEWEWAALGGEDFQYAGCTNVDEVAWYLSEAQVEDQEVKLHKVSQKKPNGYGLYDMTGNVPEWTANWCNDDIFHPRLKFEKGSNPNRVLRGGSWDGGLAGARVPSRSGGAPGDRYDYLGLRLCFSANPTTLDLIRQKGLMR